MKLKPLQKGETVYTILRHVSRSGLTRVIDAYVIRNNKPVRLSAVLTDEQYNKITELFTYDIDREGYIIKGAGTDMGFLLVYRISNALFNDGYALKQRWL